MVNCFGFVFSGNIGGIALSRLAQRKNKSVDYFGKILILKKFTEKIFRGS